MVWQVLIDLKKTNIYLNIQKTDTKKGAILDL